MLGRVRLGLVRMTSVGALAILACGTGDSTSSASSPPPDPTLETPATPAPEPTTAGPSNPPPTPTEPVPPSGLTCLAKHFVGKPKQRGATWVLELPDGTELRWDDGATKTFDTKMEQPDLEDTLSIPYARGPIAAVSTINVDPGRIRNDFLFKATFGNTANAVEAALVDVDFVGQSLRVHPRAAVALGKVSTKLKALVAQTPSLGAYLTGELGGTFAWRPIANTTRMSVHSYGAAIDIVVAKSNYWEWEKGPNGELSWKNQIPQAIVDAFEAEGFAWGGRWYHYDTMHFEYRPELFDPTCAP